MFLWQGPLLIVVVVGTFPFNGIFFFVFFFFFIWKPLDQISCYPHETIFFFYHDGEVVSSQSIEITMFIFIFKFFFLYTDNIWIQYHFFNQSNYFSISNCNIFLFSNGETSNLPLYKRIILSFREKGITIKLTTTLRLFFLFFFFFFHFS